MAQMVKRLPTMRETRVQSLGQEDLPDKEMATRSSILAWKSPMDRGYSRLQTWGRKELDTTEQLHILFFINEKEVNDDQTQVKYNWIY